jgi:hypothetical protein
MEGVIHGLLLVLCATCLLGIVPLGLRRVSRLEEKAIEKAHRALDDVAKRQTLLLSLLMDLQRSVAVSQVTIDTLRAALNSTASSESEVSREIKEITEDVRKAASLSAQEVRSRMVEVDGAVRELTFRYIVKWHGKNGPQATRRLRSQLEAEREFDQIGDFAKKMIFFDGTKWVVVRSYGAERWLEMLSNDGVAPSSAA